MIDVDIVIVVAKQVLTQQSASCCIGKPGRVVEVIIAASDSLCNAHAVARICDGKYAVTEEEPDPEAGGGEADVRPFGGHALWLVGRQSVMRRLDRWCCLWRLGLRVCLRLRLRPLHL